MVREQKLILLLVVVLTALAALCMVLRTRSFQTAHLGSGEPVWRVTYDVDVPEPKGVRLYVAVPNSTPHCRVFRESFSHHGLWMDMVKGKSTRAREVVVVPLAAAERGRFSANFDVQVSKDKQWKVPAANVSLTSEELSHYLREESSIRFSAPAVSTVLARLTTAAQSKTHLLERIFDYCLDNIIDSRAEAPANAAGVLEQRRGTRLGKARAMIALCRAAKIPARLVSGFALEAQAVPQVHVWVEVWVKKSWRAYDPVNGYRGALPPHILPVRYDGSQIVRNSINEGIRTQFSVRRVVPDLMVSSSAARGWLTVGDLTRLVPGMQGTIGLVLLLPVAALVTTLFRSLIGVRTYGTFAPSLIAMSFVQADWRTGAVVFFVVLGIGVLARLLLNRLKLLMVARLGVILTLTVASMAVAVSVLDYLGLAPTASAALLPMVILTMLVERFNITAEEDGYREAGAVFSGTLLVAACCLLVLRMEPLRRLVLVYPETLLIVVAALLLLGRYSGYRVTELWRFRDLAVTRAEERA